MLITIIFGSAGTGKTTWLAHKYAELLEKYSPKEIVFLSYTKFQTRHGARKIKGVTHLNLKQLECHTLHSFAKNSCKKDIEVFHNGYYKEMSDYLGTDIEPVERGISFMKNTMSKNDAVGANKAGLDVKSFQKKKLFYETVKANMPGAKEFIDFSDMIERAVTQNIKSNAKVLILDEAQDFSPLHWKAIYTAFKDVEEMYVAGDPMQSLYRFHGAISNYMYEMRADETILLDEGHRCSEPIMQMARMIANKMDKWTALPTWVNMQKDNFAVFYPDNNIFPLFQAVNYSRRHGYKVACLAMTFRQLVLLKHKLLGPYSSTYPSNFISGKLKEFYKGSEDNPLIFSTVHQAKGLEFDYVLINSSFGLTDFFTDYGTKEENEQDYWRMMFVAITRAKRGVIVCNLSNPRAGEPDCRDVLYYTRFGIEKFQKWLHKKGNEKHLIHNNEKENADWVSEITLSMLK